jgi:hypothetical protein
VLRSFDGLLRYASVCSPWSAFSFQIGFYFIIRWILFYSTAILGSLTYFPTGYKAENSSEPLFAFWLEQHNKSFEKNDDYYFYLTSTCSLLVSTHCKGFSCSSACISASALLAWTYDACEGGGVSILIFCLLLFTLCSMISDAPSLFSSWLPSLVPFTLLALYIILFKVPTLVEIAACECLHEVHPSAWPAPKNSFLPSIYN